MHMFLESEDIEGLDDRYRTQLINSLSGFKSANLIGTCDERKNTNLAIFTSVFHLGSHPPLLGMIVRPHSVARHTLENILLTGHYTINHVSESYYKQAHQTSARYDKETSEFQATGLTPCWHHDFPAPFVEESPVQLGMSLREHQRLAINDTVMIVGEVTVINIKEGLVRDDGYVDLEEAGIVTTSSLDTYHRTQMLSRLSYAKADRKLQELIDRKKNN